MSGMSFNLSQKRYGTCFQLNKMGKYKRKEKSLQNLINFYFYLKSRAII